MSLLNYIVTKLKTGIITFVNAVILANWDFPYHDFKSDTTTAVKQIYVVGSENKDGLGSQRKFFISKSMYIIVTTDTYVKFNHSDNVVWTLRANYSPYWFDMNIREVHYYWVSEAGTIDIGCAGVLPEEQRVPE